LEVLTSGKDIFQWLAKDIGEIMLRTSSSSMRPAVVEVWNQPHSKIPFVFTYGKVYVGRYENPLVELPSREDYILGRAETTVPGQNDEKRQKEDK
jgi:hypothetical protein